MTMPGGTWTIGRAAFEGFTGMLAGVPGGGDALALPTEPGSLKPWVLFSSGPSKKLRLNSLPASNDTSGVRVSGAGALPRPALSDWSILKTSIVRRGNGDNMTSAIAHLDTNRGHHSRTRLTWLDSRPARMFITFLRYEIPLFFIRLAVCPCLISFLLLFSFSCLAFSQ